MAERCRRTEAIKSWLDDHADEIESPAGVSVTFDFGAGEALTVTYRRVDRPRRVGSCPVAMD